MLRRIFAESVPATEPLRVTGTGPTHTVVLAEMRLFEKFFSHEKETELSSTATLKPASFAFALPLRVPSSQLLAETSTSAAVPDCLRNLTVPFAEILMVRQPFWFEIWIGKWISPPA